MTDWRSLVSRMADELDHYRQLGTDDRREVHPLAVEARAVLAASVTSPPDWRGLCEELTEHLALLDEPPHELVCRAQNALSQPEPEVVVPSDGSGKEWQWYTYCPEEGIELYSDSQQAQSAAQSIMGSYEVAAHSDGWHEDMELVSWGMLVPVEHAQVVARGPADPGGEFDEWVRYELRASRPAPAAAGEVGPSLSQVSDWITKCSQNPEENRWTRRVDHHDALAIAKAALYDWGRPAPVPAGERQAAPVPVAVSERPWERDGWCHPEERWAWFYNRRVGWRDAIPPESLKPPTLFPYTHSLPFNALPLPSLEVAA